MGNLAIALIGGEYEKSRYQLRISALGTNYNHPSPQSLYAGMPIYNRLGRQRLFQLTALIHLSHDV